MIDFFFEHPILALMIGWFLFNLFITDDESTHKNVGKVASETEVVETISVDDRLEQLNQKVEEMTQAANKKLEDVNRKLNTKVEEYNQKLNEFTSTDESVIIDKTTEESDIYSSDDVYGNHDPYK